MRKEKNQTTNNNRECSAADIERTQNLLKLLTQALVDEPMCVRVTVIRGLQSVIYEVSVARDDVRRVIGRKGRTADALREIMLNLGSKAGRRFMLEIVEPEHQAEGVATLEAEEQSEDGGDFVGEGLQVEIEES